jgi:hypothetical protein
MASSFLVAPSTTNSAQPTGPRSRVRGSAKLETHPHPIASAGGAECVRMLSIRSAGVAAPARDGPSRIQSPEPQFCGFAEKWRWLSSRKGPRLTTSSRSFTDSMAKFGGLFSWVHASAGRRLRQRLQCLPP